MSTIYGSPVCAGGKPKMKFTYTGDYVVRKDGVVELLTSGTIVFLEPKVIDLFMVGGGASGYISTSAQASGFGGGGGGYTRTVRSIIVKANDSFEVAIGAGGVAPNRPGGVTGFGAYTVNGGVYAGVQGGKGGSGGGGGVSSNSDYGSGGSDGNNGEVGYPSSATGGNGQGFTTREFGESFGKLYAGGGGGGRYMSAQSAVVSAGGAGGGGTGGWISGTGSQAAAAGMANTGGGGGGGATVTSTKYIHGASGGSGIMCFRESVELPELAGTWVMNNRIYQPATAIKELVNFTMPGYTVASYNAKGVRVVGLPTTTASFFGIWRSTDATEQYLAVYDFYTNEWQNTKDRQPAVLTFPTGATASDEFRAWLASNATKQ
jgi:hypothetical protein